MPSYTAPLKDFQFVLHDLLKVSEQDVPGYADLDRDFTAAVLEEVGKLSSSVLSPMNAVGDTEGCVLENGVVRTPPGSRPPLTRSAKAVGPHWTQTSNTVARACPISCTPRQTSRWLPPTWRSTCIRV